MGEENKLFESSQSEQIKDQYLEAVVSGASNDLESNVLNYYDLFWSQFFYK